MSERRRRQPARLKLEGVSGEARKTSAAILEVLAGMRTPAQASEALGVSEGHYYNLETKALRGMVEACEPRPKGKAPDPRREREELRRDLERLEREVARWKAVARASQRTIGLPAPPAKETSKRKRKPTVRALRALKLLQSAEPVAPPVEG